MNAPAVPQFVHEVIPVLHSTRVAVGGTLLNAVATADCLRDHIDERAAKGQVLVGQSEARHGLDHGFTMLTFRRPVIVGDDGVPDVVHERAERLLDRVRANASYVGDEDHVAGWGVEVITLGNMEAEGFAPDQCERVLERVRGERAAREGYRVSTPHAGIVLCLTEPGAGQPQ